MTQHPALCDLPRDVLLHVLSYCSALELGRISRANGLLFALSRSDDLWTPIFSRIWKQRNPEPSVIYQLSESSVSSSIVSPPKKRTHSGSFQRESVNKESLKQQIKVKEQFIRNHYQELNELGFSRINALKRIDEIKGKLDNIAEGLGRLRNLNKPGSEQEAINLLHEVNFALGDTADSFGVLFGSLHNAFFNQRIESYSSLQRILPRSETRQISIVFMNGSFMLSSELEGSVLQEMSSRMKQQSDQNLWLSDAITFLIHSCKKN